MDVIETLDKSCFGEMVSVVGMGREELEMVCIGNSLQKFSQKGTEK